MRSSEERIAQLRLRVSVLRRRRRRRIGLALCAGAAAACLALVAALALAVSRMNFPLSGRAPAGATAGIFAANGALGYAAVAILAFLLGALVTVFCVRLKKYLDRGDEKERHDDRES